MKAPDPNEKSLELSDSYSDDDSDNPFDSQYELLDLLKRLEDENLFTINLVQEDEYELKGLVESSKALIAVREREIEKVEKGIEELRDKLAKKRDRNRVIEMSSRDENMKDASADHSKFSKMSVLLY
jgi:vacuolar-type H+-ATPase subunit I/STV1